MRGLTTLHLENKPLPTVRHCSFISEHFYQSVGTHTKLQGTAPLLSAQQYAETLSLSGALFLLRR